MIIAINDNLTPRVFQTIEGYKYWCERQVEKGMNPDELIVNQVHQVNEGEEANEDNWIDVHEFHCGLYSNESTKINNTNTLLATADQLVKKLEFALETCWFTKKNDYYCAINVNDIRPNLQKLIDEYKHKKRYDY